MAAESAGVDLVSVVTLLGAAVVAVPVFKRIGLGSVLGYLAAGLAIGPFGLGLFADPMAILHVAELGVVMFLFIIGLEMEPSKLWAMRRDIFGLGLTQVLVCIAVLSLVGFALGYPYAGSLIAGAGFTLTSTAIVMQMLQERGDISAPKGQRIVSILLLEDLAIVPLLALVAFLAPGGEDVTLADRLMGVGIGLGAIVALVVAGLYLLNPMFRLLAASRAREVMTAAALLVVLGSALWLQLGGLSAAMGAFLAGVLLSESSFRHQLEADVEPFRGILLGLFFLAVGMALDLSVIAANWGLVAVSVAALMLLKSAIIYGIARVYRASHAEALERTVLMAQGGEFAFVLYSAALAVGLLSLEENAILNAVIIVSMALTPLMVILHDRLRPEAVVSLEGMEAPDGLSGSVLIIGFGRFGQIASQPLLARKCSITIIDDDPEMIRAAERFGFKVWFGDGTRLDILQAAGAGTARAVIIATDRKEVTTRIARLVKHEFPNAAVLARAFDRAHALDLIKEGVDHQMREVFHSALALGGEVLEVLGVDPDEIAEIADGVRKRDAERLALQMTGDIYSGTSLLLGNAEHTARAAS
ncbi:monovalent cation:proton antiporter-2 (CPA2) family protein [Tabrizicola sp.]|uniref:monovalent cation:proton antiporter-2 (CPA2) family protein n=1 Tax=Tabrizicola sp. TaxID=2005166 RepID=UPI0027370A91|nr:monovalent cation:proton antiporter-2 (CPA2) family protein [Tabrizicola sp.]MDP3194765.1 monovalent cation:proton antiporter-2 (CPA2) family protein [Tabrizicola sp.]MDZ4065447.1 monovalent cation:proton antiporter-2 (CPA2) family protein [Tabrizicola sp.]